MLFLAGNPLHAYCFLQWYRCGLLASFSVCCPPLPLLPPLLHFGADGANSRGGS